LCSTRASCLGSGVQISTRRPPILTENFRGLVGATTRLRVGRPRSWGSIRGRGKTFSFSITSGPALGSTLPPTRRVPTAVSPGIKWQGREADHSLPSSAKLKNDGAIPPLPCLHDVVLN
jgi:hypothetical protein